MDTAFGTRLEVLAAWRVGIDRQFGALTQLLAEHDLLEGAEQSQARALHDRLRGDRLLLVVVAEASRGKSELINAMFFADAGRRLLPAAPGRTTMCPVEILHDPAAPPQLLLLPIDTRLEGLTLAELRPRHERWQRVPLDAADPAAMAGALEALTQTLRVDVPRARELGFWCDAMPQDNPAQDADGSVRVPAWRHALINHPHPLLQRGLVVLDTPGLNAIGAEPELTLSLLPTAHACIFVLGADAGVTRSDLALWRDHLGGRPDDAFERFVVLNKIDTLADPLAAPAAVRAQIERQREQTAHTLDLPLERVFALSARDALVARIGGDELLLARSRLGALEAALADELLPRRFELLAAAALATLGTLRDAALRRLAGRRRQMDEQLLELRGLRGKSAARRRLMLQRVETEATDFERCTARLQALRAVQARVLREALAPLADERLRAETDELQGLPGALLFPGNSRKSLSAMFDRLRALLAQAASGSDELRQLLEAGFQQLNTEFGFACLLAPLLVPGRHADELALIERSHARHFDWPRAWRLSTPGYAERFRRMLKSRLQLVFENAAGEVDRWSRSAAAQLDQQLRERRRQLVQRHDALGRVDAAAGALESSIADLEHQGERLLALQRSVEAAAAQIIAAAQEPPSTDLTRTA